MTSMDSTNRIGHPGPKRWLGIGLRLLATLFFLLLVLALNRCSSPIRPMGRPAVTATAVEAASARLRVEVRPAGAKVSVDGLRTGTTPVSLALPSGQHDLRVELDGYEALVQTVNLAAGTERIVAGELARLPSVVAPTSTPPPAQGREPNLSLPDLTIKHIKVELETGGACDYASTQLGVRVIVENAGDADAGSFAVDVNGARQAVDSGLAVGRTTSLWFGGYSLGGENTVVVDATNQVEESNKNNNSLSQMLPVPTLPPTCTPPP